jgi:hypothetical protein
MLNAFDVGRRTNTRVCLHIAHVRRQIRGSATANCIPFLDDTSMNFVEDLLNVIQECDEINSVANCPYHFFSYYAHILIRQIRPTKHG